MGRERKFFWKELLESCGILLTCDGTCPFTVHQVRRFQKENGHLVIGTLEFERTGETNTWPLPEKFKGQGLWLAKHSDSQARKGGFMAVCSASRCAVSMMQECFVWARWAHSGERAELLWKAHTGVFPKRATWRGSEALRVSLWIRPLKPGNEGSHYGQMEQTLQLRWLEVQPALETLLKPILLSSSVFYIWKLSIGHDNFLLSASSLQDYLEMSVATLVVL